MGCVHYQHHSCPRMAEPRGFKPSAFALTPPAISWPTSNLSADFKTEIAPGLSSKQGGRPFRIFIAKTRSLPGTRGQGGQPTRGLQTARNLKVNTRCPACEHQAPTAELAVLRIHLGAEYGVHERAGSENVRSTCTSLTLNRNLSSC